MRTLLLAVALTARAALAQTLFDGGAPALPITKQDARIRTTPLNQTYTAADMNSVSGNIYLIEQALLGDGGTANYSQLSSGWLKAFDCDFSAQANTALDGGDGTVYTICGLPWTTTGRGAGSNTWGYAEIDAGLTLVQYDAGDTGSGYCMGNNSGTVTGIYTSLYSIIPNLTPSTGIRATVQWTGAPNATTSHDAIIVTASPWKAPSPNFNMGPCLRYGWTTQLAFQCVNSSNTSSAWGASGFPGGSPWNAPSWTRITARLGYGDGQAHCAVNDGGVTVDWMPAAAVPSTTVTAGSLNGFDPPNVYLLLAAGRTTNASPPLIGSIKRVILEYKP